ncbi:dihydrodipicolinate reductase [Mycobacterium sp. 852002-51152_SCH6134967]|uniref:NAD(P)H-dependent amine dehydrogenase family protein n=1 Tax=Mycobacterium sp. 852002-51152_SCH6134967 TaxID=1834096 RepID=UPI0007FF9914|nr:dihydrodipicolinate reductase [Mycobacterium sp. 852002-51152_SCH6134967]OBF92025.1 dihydrodipicolinate reductase [Mycobacterium sp. 852002-51152_SCH6134967]
MQRHRVIAWGTGAVGVEMITAVLDNRSAFDLVGARVYSAAKDGVDVGTLAGRESIGVAATTDVDQILALDADCVLYTPRNTDVDEVCAILASGKNVATTAFLFHPRRTRPADRDRLLDACKTGNSTVHGSGLNPGNLSGVLPLALSGMSRTIDRVTLQERADWSVYDSTAITFDNMCFGEPVETISPAGTDFLAFNSAIFSEQVWLIADALNAGIDEVTASVDAVAATSDHQIFDRVLAAGTTAGQRWTWSGRRDGETLVEIETLWTVGNEYPTHWPKPQHGWTLTIEGDPSMRTHFFSLASFSRDAGMPEHVRSANVATAMQVLNAVPAIVAAPAGFATMADLPLIRSHIGFGNG